jgi:hypothetical protein
MKKANKLTVLMTMAGIAVVVLMGALLALGLWELLVYPTVLAVLWLVWDSMERKVKSNPDHPIGFLEHTDAMGFGIVFMLPAFLFLAGWTFYLFSHENAIIRWVAYLVAAGSLSLLFLMNRMEAWIKERFFEKKGRHYVRKKR